MAVIVITSHGTLGDILPLIALGQELQQSNHQVWMVISESMHSYALKAGLKALSNGRDPLGQKEAQKNPQEWNHLRGAEIPNSQYCDAFLRHIIQGLPCLSQSCERADLLISTPQQNMIAAIIQEKLSIPWVSVSVTPSLYCIERKNIQQTSNPEERLLNGKLHKIVQKIRQSINLSSPLSSEDWENYSRCEHLVLGFSPHFSRPNKAYSHAIQTGFWFYQDPDWHSWQPDAKLRDFMEQESKPLVLSFSSQPLEEARSVVEVHVRAAAQLGKPILIQQGWADFNQEHLPPDCDRDQVMFAGFMPQDWLFERAAALIHHGGIGTTARALRNGCPMLVEPYGNDQFFNAKQIILHGIGAAMSPIKLQVDQLSQVLQDKVLNPEYKARAEAMGGKIKQEAGLIKACDYIESCL